MLHPGHAGYDALAYGHPHGTPQFSCRKSRKLVVFFGFGTMKEKLRAKLHVHFVAQTDGRCSQPIIAGTHVAQRPKTLPRNLLLYTDLWKS